MLMVVVHVHSCCVIPIQSSIHTHAHAIARIEGVMRIFVTDHRRSQIDPR